MNNEEKALKKQQKLAQRQKEIHPLRYRKAGVLLTRAEVEKIKAEKKKLKADMKLAGITDPKDKKILESARGAYFDKRRGMAAIAWIVHGKVLAIVLATLVLALTVLFLISEITKMRGHFSVNITQDLFSRGFSIGEHLENDRLKDPTSYLKGDVLENTPCASITWIDENVDGVEGPHNGESYFAYTFYIENAGETAEDYTYAININSQSKNAADAVWIMLFVDGKMTFYAKATKEGDNQTLPERTDNSKGYRNPPFMSVAALREEQFELIENENAQSDYYRLIALPFESETTVTSGLRQNVQPGEVHKYTVVMWIEGDDPQCTNDIIGGHVGIEFNFKLSDKTNPQE